MWKAVETEGGEIRVVETKRERGKRGSRKKAGRKKKGRRRK